MKPPLFSYHDPCSTDDVVGLLTSLDNAKLLAGGQSLMPMLNMRFVLPDHVIDLNRVEGLSYIRDHDGALEIGAMTRQRDIEFSDLVRERCPLMHEAVRQVGHRQTRNRGTLGGSLCHLDPAAELVSVAAAHDAKISVIGKNGARSIDFAAFPIGYMTSSIALDELRRLAPQCKLILWAAMIASDFTSCHRRQQRTSVGKGAGFDIHGRRAVGLLSHDFLALGIQPMQHAVTGDEEY